MRDFLTGVHHSNIVPQICLESFVQESVFAASYQRKTMDAAVELMPGHI
jgi:hypothetical protein